MSTVSDKLQSPLTEMAVVQHLLKRGLLSARSVTKNDISVMNISRRNWNFQVVNASGPSYIVKRGRDAEGLLTVASEAAIYRSLKASPDFTEMMHSVPEFCSYDEDEHILITQLFPNTRNLQEHHTITGRFSTELGAAQGRVLGTLHRITGGRVKRNGTAAPGDRPPWILSIHEPGTQLLQTGSGANIELVRMIQRSPEFCNALERLRNQWHPSALIHHDVKWDNWLVPETTAGRAPRRDLKLIDWELACIGDPCWDAGSVFNDYLRSWVLSIPITALESVSRVAGACRYPLETMQPAIRAYWRSYIHHMAVPSTNAYEWLIRSIRYGSVRLIQTAYEWMRVSSKLTGNIVCLVQLSMNIMRRPEEAVTGLLGLGPDFEVFHEFVR